MNSRNCRMIAAAAVSMLSAAFFDARADEGMWLPSLIGDRIADMQDKGLALSAEDIYSINQASLKDAVVLFGRGCTGELISDEGLLLTNHHCGYPQIQKHSTVDHDYLRDGFWAMTRDEELPNDGLTVSFLERMEDVTADVLRGYVASMTEAQRDSLVKANSETLVSSATAEGKGLEADVESLYYGNTYYLFVYRVYTDIRLVGAPPSSIGKFGGDTDNWMWPRHTGDFSIFRIYADKDNNPAPYSEDNVPYHPKKSFTISLGGVSEGDFTFVYGYPGRTQEYIMSEGVRYISEVSDPMKVALRTTRLDIQKKYMDSSQDLRIRYSSKNASVANAWKKWQGEMKGIRKMGTVSRKQEFERRFSLWAEGTEYDGLVGKLDTLYSCLEPYSFATDCYAETARAVELVNFASRYRSGDTLYARNFYKDYHLPLDKETFVAMMEEFGRLMAGKQLPRYYAEQMEACSGSVQTWADSLFGNSAFADSLRLFAADSSRLAVDPAVEFAKEFSRWYASEIRPAADSLNSLISLLNRDYMRGQMEFCKDKDFYPDANLTLRAAYGSVKGYSPSDGVIYEPVSTLEGIMQKDNPDIFDYNIPQRLRDIYTTKDYGRWSVVDSKGNKTVPVCFLATNHTSGGNSGSPVIDARGNLIGINFDRVWEGTMSDIVFDPELCRNISLDIRYVLFIIDKVAGAGHLMDEMNFTE